MITKRRERGQVVVPLLAIDGGGTKTIAIITDETGTILGTGQSGTSNYHVTGKENTIKTLQNVISDAVERFKKEASLAGDTDVVIKLGVFALAGLDTETDQANVQEIVKNVIADSGVRFGKVIVENDALSALLGATNGQPGVLLIAGTGSIAFAHDGNGEFLRSGGWGHLLGDEGGGYWIGKEAISAILKMFDGRGTETLLADLVIDYLKLESHEQLYNWVYGPGYSIHKVAALSTIVEEAYLKGDLVSREILDRAVDELFALICGVAKHSGILGKPFKLLFLGGVLQNSDYIKEALTKKVHEEMPNVELLPNHQKPINLIIQRGLSICQGDGC